LESGTAIEQGQNEGGKTWSKGKRSRKKNQRRTVTGSRHEKKGGSNFDRDLTTRDPTEKSGSKGEGPERGTHIQTATEGGGGSVQESQGWLREREGIAVERWGV